VELILIDDIATDRKVRTTINSLAYAVEGIYCRLVLTALATAISALIYFEQSKTASDVGWVKVM